MMRRPLFYAAVSCGAAIFSAYFFGTKAALLPATGCFGVFLLTSREGTENRSRRCVLLVLLCYLASLVSVTLEDTRMAEAAYYWEREARIAGKILKVERGETGDGRSYLQMVIRTESIDGAAVGGPFSHPEILLRYYGDSLPEAVPGMKVSASGALERPAGRRNPGCFDYRLYLRSLGIHTVMTAEEMELPEPTEKTSLPGILHLRKEAFLERLEDAAGRRTAAMVRALLFGEKKELDEDLLETFQKNGTAHVLAVSGLHVGILYGFLCLLWRWKKGLLFFGVVMAFFGCYMILASFSPSVVRAVWMVGLHCFARMANRRYDLTSAALAVALVLLLKNPMQLFHAGFQMSFLAVLTLALFLPVIKRVYSGIFLAGGAIQLGLLPYTVYSFNYLSLGAVFVNVPVIFLTGVLVPTGMGAFLLADMWEPVFRLLAGCMFGLTRILETFNDFTCLEGVTVFQTPSPRCGFLICYYLCLVCFLSEEGRLLFLRRKKKVLLCLAAAVTGLSLLFGQAADDGFRKADLVFVDVGQGDCIHIRTEEGKNFLVDGGGSPSYNAGKKTLKPYLLKNGVGQVEGAFVTHLHTDHYQGIAELCREGMVKRLFLYEGNRVKEGEILQETGLSPEQLTYLYQGQEILLGRNAGARVLWPARQTEDRYLQMSRREEEEENDSSLILQLGVEGGRALATGDVDQACQDMLVEKWGPRLKSEIVKAAHHGSRYSYSEEFVQAAKPRYAVFQVGKNNYGHPDPEVVQKYRTQGAEVYRNDLDGAVGFYIGDGKVTKTVTMGPRDGGERGR